MQLDEAGVERRNSDGRQLLSDKQVAGTVRDNKLTTATKLHSALKRKPRMEADVRRVKGRASNDADNTRCASMDLIGFPLPTHCSAYASSVLHIVLAFLVFYK